MSENSQIVWKCIWYNNLRIETWSQFEEEDPVARDWDDAPDEIVEYRISHPAKELTDEESLSALIYEMLCDHELCPPKGCHWEGFIADEIAKAILKEAQKK